MQELRFPPFKIPVSFAIFLAVSKLTYPFGSEFNKRGLEDPVELGEDGLYNDSSEGDLGIKVGFFATDGGKPLFALFFRALYKAVQLVVAILYLSSHKKCFCFVFFLFYRTHTLRHIHLLCRGVQITQLLWLIAAAAAHLIQVSSNLGHVEDAGEPSLLNEAL